MKKRKLKGKRQCKRMYLNYKDACDQSMSCRNVRDSKKMKEIVNNIDGCMLKRLKHHYDCIPQRNWDWGHLEYLRRIKFNRTRCKNKWSRLGYPEHDFPQESEVLESLYRNYSKRKKSKKGKSKRGKPLLSEECEELKKKKVGCMKSCKGINDSKEIQERIDQLNDCISLQKKYYTKCETTEGQKRNLETMEQAKAKCLKRKLIRINKAEEIFEDLKLPPLKTKTLRTPSRYLELLAKREKGEIYIDEIANLVSFRIPGYTVVASGKGERGFLNLLQVIADTAGWVVPIFLRTKEGIQSITPQV